MHLHLIAFNIPFPANYGGVIDVYYKVKALHTIGVKVHLHCFEYGRATADELNDISESVTYYKRDTSLLKHTSTLPFIVNSRLNNNLLTNLLKDDFPILFEGLHCSGFAKHPSLNNRQKFIRMHNIEWQYYEHLATKELTLWKQLFFKLESWKLKRFERTILTANNIKLLTISPNDTRYFKSNYPHLSSIYVPAFHPNETVNSKLGNGNYALFHGDLSVKDNEDAALFLIDKVFKQLDCKLIIAGLNPSEKLLAKATENVVIKGNVPQHEMNDLLENAQLNILISFHSAGMKLKLLNALFKGRFCVVNQFMVDGTGLEDYCLIGADADALRQKIEQVYHLSFDESQQEKRKILLASELSNLRNVEKIYRQLALSN